MDIDPLLHEIEDLDPASGISLLNVLELSEPLAKLIRALIRMRPVTAERIASQFHIDEEAAGQLVQLMLDKGFLKAVPRPDGTTHYRARFQDSGDRGFANSVWDSFDS